MNQQHDELIDLGSVESETKGGPVGKDDHETGRILAEGLSDE
ncbi:MAG TPA: hypothetical protein VE820_06340 [Sphingomicrobium sp.]|jgi:hypothetical protein|nr:hypothetical protein [Sphingomicrobium sp.]